MFLRNLLLGGTFSGLEVERFVVLLKGFFCVVSFKGFPVE